MRESFINNYLLRVFKNFLKYIFLPIISLAILWLFYFKLYGNFHKMDDDFFRSAQLYEFNMPYYIKEYKIKSIINLRGKSEAQWYKDEMRISKEYNVNHYDFGLAATKIQSVATMDRLLELIKKAEKPVLVHCKAGADRTSLANALYEYKIKNDKNAEKFISILYGHFPWLGSRTKAMDISFENYKKQRPLEHVK